MALEALETIPQRTTTDMVFEALLDQILTLKMLPGTRISEADVAAKLGVSRQPVRDAFNRLSNLQLVKIRPQRATVVSGFSLTAIENARFVRMAVELEVARQACRQWTPSYAEALEANIKLQRDSMTAGDIDGFHQLDYDFHKLICAASGHPLAFETILECKQKVDRLCMLSLASVQEMAGILADHEAIAAGLAEGSQEKTEMSFRDHLSRLDALISDLYDKHLEYFE